MVCYLVPLYLVVIDAGDAVVADVVAVVAFAVDDARVAAFVAFVRVLTA